MAAVSPEEPVSTWSRNEFDGEKEALREEEEQAEAGLPPIPRGGEGEVATAAAEAAATAAAKPALAAATAEEEEGELEDGRRCDWELVRKTEAAVSFGGDCGGVERSGVAAAAVAAGSDDRNEAGYDVGNDADAGRIGSVA